MDLAFAVLAFLGVVSLLASTINGGLGYGYSSISTPLALLVVVNRVINPVYVAVEACMNTGMLVFSGKADIRATFRRILPIVAGLVPAILIGSYFLFVVSPSWVRFVVYVTVLPLILLQAGGLRRPIRSERAAGAPLGFGVGLLYSISTISGPPIALFFNNQGLPKGEFKAAVAQIRIVESYLTSATYLSLGLFTTTSLQLLTWVAPPVLVGIPAGIFIVRRVRVETFRRACMSFDAWIVGYGLAVVLGSLFGLVDFGYAVLALVIGIDATLLYRFFSKNRVLQSGQSRRRMASRFAEEADPERGHLEAPPISHRPPNAALWHDFSSAGYTLQAGASAVAVVPAPVLRRPSPSL